MIDENGESLLPNNIHETDLLSSDEGGGEDLIRHNSVAHIAVGADLGVGKREVRDGPDASACGPDEGEEGIRKQRLEVDHSAERYRRSGRPFKGSRRWGSAARNLDILYVRKRRSGAPRIAHRA